MPRRYRGKGKRKAMTRPRRPARRAPRNLTVNRALHPIPQRFITKMKYAEAVNTDTTGHFAFNLNSIFDPNRTGVGHQPYGFDTLATLYNRYRVIACGWRITAPVQDGTTRIQVAAMPGNEVKVFTSMSEARENPRAKYINQIYGAAQAVLSGKCYLPALVGRNRAQYMADDSYQAQVTGSPGELCILNIATATAAGINDFPSTAAIQITLEYTVEFFDVKTLAQS